MKLIILALLFSGTAWSAKIFNENIEEFQEEMHIKVMPALKKHAAENLKKAEKEINEINAKFERGQSLYSEALYPESILDRKDFEKAKEGLIPNTVGLKKRSMGLIPRPEAERNGPLNDIKLAKMDAELAMNRATTPASYNGVTEGYVTSVKNQGNCGSCAAFAATAMHEVAMVKAGATFKGLDLSEQELVDCGYNGQAMKGCNGAGIAVYTDWFIKKRGGQGAHENTYPYKAKRKSCPSKLTVYKTGKKISAFVEVEKAGEKRIMQTIAKYGSAIVGMRASDNSFGNYKKGIYTGCKSAVADHAVLAVGYGTDAKGNKYWLVKNSWGTNWGEKGYFRIQRGTNMCGIEKSEMSAASATSASGSPSAVPTAAAKTTAAPSSSNAGSCDVSKMFGNSNINGQIDIQTENGFKYLVCTNSVCKADPEHVTGVTNVCKYICGRATCNE